MLSANAPTIQAVAARGGSLSLFEQARRLCVAGGTTVDEVVRVLGEVG